MSRKRDRGDGKVAAGDAGLALAAKAERKLLRQERKAEATLDDARARMAKAVARLQRRQTQVAAAEAALIARQAARAAGPDGTAETAAPDGLAVVAPGGAAPDGPASGKASTDTTKPRRRTTRRAEASTTVGSGGKQ